MKHYCIFPYQVPLWRWLKEAKTCRRTTTCLYIIVQLLDYTLWTVCVWHEGISGSRGNAPCTVNLNIMWTWAVSFTRLLYLKERASWCPRNSCLSGQPNNLSIHLEEIKNLLPLAWLKPRFLGCPVHSLDTKPTTLSWLQTSFILMICTLGPIWYNSNEIWHNYRLINQLTSYSSSVTITGNTKAKIYTKMVDF
jgi:hypothetical protein